MCSTQHHVSLSPLVSQPAGMPSLWRSDTQDAFCASHAQGVSSTTYNANVCDKHTVYTYIDANGGGMETPFRMVNVAQTAHEDTPLRMKHTEVTVATSVSAPAFSAFFSDRHSGAHTKLTLDAKPLSDVCAACLAAGASMFECAHAAFEHPPFSLSMGRARAARMFISDREKFEREMMDIPYVAEQKTALHASPADTVVHTYIDVRADGVTKRTSHKLEMKSIVLGAASSSVVVGMHTRRVDGAHEVLYQAKTYFKSLAESPFLRGCRHVLVMQRNASDCLTPDFFLLRAQHHLARVWTVEHADRWHATSSLHLSPDDDMPQLMRTPTSDEFDEECRIMMELCRVAAPFVAHTYPRELRISSTSNNMHLLSVHARRIFPCATLHLSARCSVPACTNHTHTTLHPATLRSRL
jgi:hypothetical protein